MSHALLQRLRHADPAERRAACADAADDPSAVLLVDGLVEALGDPDGGVARAASDALAALGRRDGAVQTKLKEALHGDSGRRRFGAAFTLARLAPPHPGLLPALVEALGARDGDVRWAAARLLVDTGRLHGEVLRVALGLARTSENPVTRRMAAFCLRELAPERPEAAATLLEATHDDDLHVRRAAFTALAALVDPPERVAVRLLEMLDKEGEDATLRGLAAVALGELGAQHPGFAPESAVATLERLRAEAADPGLRRAAEHALGRLGRSPGAEGEEQR